MSWINRFFKKRKENKMELGYREEILSIKKITYDGILDTCFIIPSGFIETNIKLIEDELHNLDVEYENCFD